MSSTCVPQLDYAPAVNLRWRKRRRLIFCTLFLLVIAWPIYCYTPPIARQLHVYYLQHQCLRYSASSDLLVYDDDPADVAAIAARPNYQLLTNRNFAAPNFPRIAAYMPHCWNDFTSAIFPNRNPTSAAAIVFCQELTSRDGVRRLVIIEHGTDGPHYPYRYLNLDVVIIQPATLTTKPIDLTPAPQDIWYTGATVRQTNPLRVYAGQPDPADASRFTIRYAMGKTEHLLEGRLNDGGADVTIGYLKPLSPP